MVLLTIQDWVVAKSSHIFWLNGVAGTGKSTLAESIFRELQQSMRLGAFFTCRRDETSLSTPLNVLPTIAYQLGIANTSYGKMLLQLLGADPSIEMSLGYGETQCSKLFIEPISHLLTNTTHEFKIIVVDALDE
ncbi:hypothetical protein BDN72DRAFT_765696, partial [Pluteus cervinus]